MKKRKISNPISSSGSSSPSPSLPDSNWTKLKYSFIFPKLRSSIFLISFLIFLFTSLFIYFYYFSSNETKNPQQILTKGKITSFHQVEKIDWSKNQLFAKEVYIYFHKIFQFLIFLKR